MALAEIAAVAGAISYVGVSLVGSLYYWKVGRHLPENIRDANQLYLCTDCRDYSRTYQQVLTHKIKRIAEQNFESPHYDMRCPHCLAKYAMRQMDDRDIHKWMDTEPKFPKLSLRGYLKYQKELKRLDQEFRDLRAIVAFQKYHQIEIAPPALHKGKGVSKQKAEGLLYTVHHFKKPENHEVQAVNTKEAARIEAEWNEEAEELVEKIRTVEMEKKRWPFERDNKRPLDL